MKAAIFDFDGTLVDTMPLHYEAYRRVFARAGFTLTERAFYENIGGKALETIPRFLASSSRLEVAREGTTPAVHALHAEKKLELERILNETPSALTVLDTAKLLPALAAHVPLAIASSGSRAGIERMLALLGWSRYFTAVITGEDAERGKPAPDLFLIAANKLRVASSDCVAFEDTDDGVRAAEAAGMTCVDVRKTAAPSSRATLAEARSK